MRKITEKAVHAFYAGKPFKQKNTEVRQEGNETIMLLHGNEIAYRKHNKNIIGIVNRDWFTNTTKERLNGLKNVDIVQKNYEWYLNGKKWNGTYIEVKQ